ncbi:MAG: hypothetical protein A2Y03_06540 [Omnitrophica WOR_2 bacterium GWF2_38_59]|nr:MAG: hypothetical protein A2Y03_06540 [Omnitrophica WOR_2 bacterium GWF2_38_59]OGX50491.1 MAG: hypothetical protein A2243_02035 [Omnitrophica WOR_2 bacterium RIFOXYA2_FULL_38_17]OGX52165.1 MAG: hypothetical protein A2267_06775 [Omnitrophica WOR_2 bacterium RIFOXYA12_FULL_38_10]OGX59500.1 MAG: hypothetical protein A2306_09660 [Omnitrophica WOR_2 bacterium RIFOXYB2_FULL_38_16]HBG62033.1 hypothetical protein [Candidatus Omnitrophota bacterium]
MTKYSLTSKKEEFPVLVIIQHIKDGRLDPKTINKDLRQQCVEVLLLEGYGVSSLAQIFIRSDKTIRRDIEEIRERNAISPKADLARKIIGEMVVNARNHQGYLMRLARSQGASVSEKGQCEYLAALVLFQNVSKLQSLGYLPSQPKTVVGELFHYYEEDRKSIPEYKKIIKDLELTAKKTGSLTPEVAKEIRQLKQQVNEADIHEKVNSLTERNKIKKTRLKS